MNTDDLVLWRRRWSYHRSAWGAHHKTHSHKGIRVELGDPAPAVNRPGSDRISTEEIRYDR